jgi:MFS family permease
VLGPLVAVALLDAGVQPDPAWRIMLALGAVPAVAVFYLRRTISETPRFRLAHQKMAEATARAHSEGNPTGLRAALADPQLRRWLIGASLALFLFDIAFYGNTVSSSTTVEKVAPHASLVQTSLINLAVFTVFSLPFYFAAAFTIDRIGRRTLQIVGFLGMTGAFLALWAVPAATSSIAVCIVVFGLTYVFANWGPNTTTFVYPAELFPVTTRTTCHGITAAAGKLGGFVGTAAIPAMVTTWGFPRAALVVSAVTLLGAGVTAWLLSEPKQKSLEEISDHSAVFEMAA